MTTAREDSALLRQVYAGALQRDPEEQGEYLDRACADNPGLRARVVTLLEAHSQDFLEGEDIEGKIVGPYIIRREIGRGGMGVVYLADDTRLSRRVALKPLNPGLGTELVPRERLRHEARPAAGLSHPGIAT